jgi:hypothetical protein
MHRLGTLQARQARLQAKLGGYKQQHADGKHPAAVVAKQREIWAEQLVIAAIRRVHG